MIGQHSKQSGTYLFRFYAGEVRCYRFGLSVVQTCIDIDCARSLSIKCLPPSGPSGGYSYYREIEPMGGIASEIGPARGADEKKPEYCPYPTLKSASLCDLPFRALEQAAIFCPGGCSTPLLRHRRPFAGVEQGGNHNHRKKRRRMEIFTLADSALSALPIRPHKQEQSLSLSMLPLPSRQRHFVTLVCVVPSLRRFIELEVFDNLLRIPRGSG